MSADLQPWISIFPWSGSSGDVDHLLPECPTVRAAQRHGVYLKWGPGRLDVNGSDVCRWCHRVYMARAKRDGAA